MPISSYNEAFTILTSIWESFFFCHLRFFQVSNPELQDSSDHRFEINPVAAVDSNLRNKVRWVKNPNLA